MKQFHPYHMVFMSPWPLLTGMNTMSLLMGTTLWMYNKTTFLMTMSLLMVVFLSGQWWRDVSRESSLQGFHSDMVMKGLRWGMILFIVSEVLFFFSFFWAFFHSSLAPNLEMGNNWPPLGTMALNPFQIPLLNTAVLLSSGITATLAHHSLIKNNNKNTKTLLMTTVMLGLYFTTLQAWEYWDASYSISDSSFGSTFFLATGFHGLHVIIGTLFLYVALQRLKNNIFSKHHHAGLELAIWYWHFVDVVWLFLYTFVYWWSY